MKNESPAVKIAETLVFTQLQPDGTFKAVEITENYRRKMAHMSKMTMNRGSGSGPDKKKV